jgi:hypothetical protein
VISNNYSSTVMLMLIMLLIIVKCTTVLSLPKTNTSLMNAPDLVNMVALVQKLDVNNVGIVHKSKFMLKKLWLIIILMDLG